MDENELIHRSRSGDIDSFNQLVKQYQEQIYNLSLHIMGDGPSADDATQDALFSAWRAINRYRSGNFRAWLLRIATNVCRDKIRSRKRHPTVSLDAMPVEPDLSSSDNSKNLQDPKDYVTNLELNNEIQAGLAQLSREQRIVVILSDIQGLNYEEISQITDCSLGTVKSRLSRGRQVLRDYLLKNGTLSL
jgi:RNA polymerase sigma-70 factor (ECF subfamily)